MIVESPAKAKTITKFLGSGFKVMASYGHVRDLPTKGLGIDVDHNFEPTYVVPPKAKSVIIALQKELKDSEGLYLATDLDREGEAISWHLEQVLKTKLPAKRITFHEISKSAIDDAIKHSRQIDANLVEAQTARRVLDRLVGYTLSPFLWQKVAARLSAGRVQSVTVRLVVEKEREIQAFKAVEYWSVIAVLNKKGDSIQFNADLVAIDDKTIGRTALSEKQAKSVESTLKSASYKITQIDKKEVFKSPPPPYTTSTLQQEANRKLGWSAKRTMTVAQHLYEDGFITYMRTDSVQMAKSAINEARDVAKNSFGAEFVPTNPRFFANRTKGAQEAHEAIRPVHFSSDPDQLKKELDAGAIRLYELIWKRALASQMADAKFERTAVNIAAANCMFRANGQIPLFLGYLKVYIETKAEAEEEIEGVLPKLLEGDLLHLNDLLVEQHFTEPPARYTEASLVKMLEELEIGRPSTYAPTLETIQNRGYVVLEEKKFIPTDIGMLVTDLLVEHFASIVDYQFTAELEEKLDDIAEGKRQRVQVLSEFYTPYSKLLKQKSKELKKDEIMQEETDQKCPKCGKNLVIKTGRFGRFYSCSGYPDCDYTDKIAKSGKPAVEPKTIGRKCPDCGEDLVERVGRFGVFVGCSSFPKCKFIESKPSAKIKAKCPLCDSPLVEKRTKKAKLFWGCSTYPKCDYATWNNPDTTPPTLENGGNSKKSE
jgi:DNA topoisomerase-1